MKRFIKNNLKVLVAIIITTIIVGSVSVYAASQYFARDITFTPSEANLEKGFKATNVEEALNELYSSTNNDLSIFIQGQSNIANSQVSSAQTFLKKYKYFKITQRNVNSYVSSCDLYLWGNGQTNVTIVENREYLISDYSDYSAFLLHMKGNSSSKAQCTYSIYYYN